MKMLSFLALAAAAIAVLPAAANARGHGCGCCAVYAAPVAASPAAAATDATAPSVAQNQQGYRSYSYQPAAAPAMNYNSGYSSGYRRNTQPMWMNGANKSLGRYN